MFTVSKNRFPVRISKDPIVYPWALHIGSRNTSDSSVCARPTDKKPARSQDEYLHLRIPRLQLLFKLTPESNETVTIIAHLLNT